MKKRFLFPALLFVFIAIIFTIGCTNHLLKPHQSDLSILVKLEKSSGRNVTTGDYQITAWIENRDGTKSHHQNLNSASGEETSLIFDNLVIGSQINIHLELTKNDDNQTKLTGESDWITVKEGEQVIEIPLESQANTDDSGEGNGSTSGGETEGEGDPVLSHIEAQYASGEYQLVNTNIDPSKITITQHFDDGSQTEVNGQDYTIAFVDGVDKSNAIGKVPATVTHGTVSATFTIPVKYTLDASNLTINGTTSVEQNGTLELTANYPDTTYQIYDDNGGLTTYQVKDNLNISWTGATAQSDAWKATANTQTTGQNTATVKLTSTDTEWCVTTSEIEKSHSYEVTKPAPSYDSTVGLSWDSSTSYLTIYNEQGLKNFRDIVNGTLEEKLSVDNKTFEAKKFNSTVNARLAADIELKEESWTPIAFNYNYAYAGTFDGAGYTVSGISITSGTDKGFFGYIQDGSTIKNLTVEGSIVASSNSGGIVAYSRGGTIQYCVNKVQVTSTSNYVGGIVGYVYYGTPSITGCVNLAQITGNDYVGGIIGYSSGNYAATIDKCINLGSVNSSNTNLSHVGGIQGYSNVSSNKITNSLNLGTINNSKGNGAGIICNDASLTIQYCLSAGTISASSKYAVASSSGTYTRNYYDSEKITEATTTGGTGRTSTNLKVASAWDTSWTTNWSFAAGRYPVPNIQNNIPSDIWKDIVEAAK